MSIAICTHGDAPHAPLYLYADSAGEVPVVAEQGPRGYEITNRYADGIIGVRGEDRTEAEVDESPACIEHLCPVSYWEHPERLKLAR